MKVAILILAYKNPGQLRKLVDFLKKDFEVFIHFDKRSDISSHFTDEEHVHILKKRYPAYWGSSNAVLATLELLRTAHEQGCDYYIHISGQDLPAKSNNDLKAYVKEHYTDHIYYFELPQKGWGANGGLERLTLYWETKYDNTPLKRVILAPLRGIFSLVRKLQTGFNIYRPLPFKPYGGSFCLNLTKEGAYFILSFVDKNKSFLERFRFTRCTDEIFFQTILLGFDYAQKHKIINADMRFQDWTTGPTYPRVFTMVDFERCINTNDFFSRKFDEHVDAEVIDKILATLSA